MTTRRVGTDELVAVALGGVMGALARAAISVAVPPPDRAAWPWATFATNLIGCLALGLLLAWIDSRHPRWLDTRPRRARLARPLLASGVLGGFTTFSAYSAEVVGLLDSGRAVSALSYAVLSAVLGVALVLVGRTLGSALLGAAPISLRADEDL